MGWCAQPSLQCLWLLHVYITKLWNMQRIISLICLKLTWTALHCIFSVSAWCHGPDPVCQNVSPTSLFRNCWKAPQHNTEMHVFCFLWWMNESFSLVESGPPWFIEINKGCLCSWTLIWKLAPCFWNLQQFLSKFELNHALIYCQPH